MPPIMRTVATDKPWKMEKKIGQDWSGSKSIKINK